MPAKRNIKVVSGERDQQCNDSSEDFIYCVETVSAILENKRQWFIKLSVKDEPPCDVKCQLHCGSTCNTMSYAQYCKLTRNNSTGLNNSNVKLQMYDGSLIKPLRKAQVQCIYNEKPYQLMFRILKKDVTPLLSAQTSAYFLCMPNY